MVQVGKQTKILARVCQLMNGSRGRIWKPAPHYQAILHGGAQFDMGKSGELFRGMEIRGGSWREGSGKCSAALMCRLEVADGRGENV